jgi:hypothetical protein
VIMKVNQRNLLLVWVLVWEQIQVRRLNNVREVRDISKEILVSLG